MENTILSQLLYNDAYARKVIPYIKKEYFSRLGEQVTHKLINDHYRKYSKPPTKESLLVDLQNTALKESVYDEVVEVIESLQNSDNDEQWLVTNTEEFCKRQAFFNAISKAASALESTDTSQYGAMLDIVSEAISVSFDNSVGHDYLEDAEKRLEEYHEKKDHLPCDLAEFNDVTMGGFVNKSMTVFLAPTGVGKTLFLCHFAASFLAQGKNVLYITLEMGETQITKRIDANLLDISIKDLAIVEKNSFLKRILKLKKSTIGKLIIKEYPGTASHAGHFRHALNELKLKKKMKPDVIIVDYLGICGSSRMTKANNSYDYVKAVAEELRGLGTEFSARVFSAVQVNREGTKSSDFEMTDTAESWGVPATADYMYGIVSTPELAKMGQIKIKRLKDRYNDYTTYKPSFLIGINRDKMRLQDLDADAQTGPSMSSEHKEEETSSSFKDMKSKFAALTH